MANLPVLTGKKLQSAHLKLTLRTGMELRALKGATLLLYQIKTNSEEAKAIVEGGASYSQACQAAGKGHQLRPLGPHSARMMVQALVAKGPEAVGADHHEVLSKYDKKWEECEDMEDVFEDVPICQLVKHFNSSLKKLERGFCCDIA